MNKKVLFDKNTLISFLINNLSNENVFELTVDNDFLYGSFTINELTPDAAGLTLWDRYNLETIDRMNDDINSYYTQIYDNIKED